MRTEVEKQELLERGILDDVVLLIAIVKEAIETDNIDTTNMVSLYESYKFLRDANEYGIEFLDGYFEDDINLPSYQETESFPTPKAKWEYFTRCQLKKFNTPLERFIRNLYSIGKKDSAYQKLMSDTFFRSKMVAFLDNKILLGNEFTIEEMQLKCNYQVEESYKAVYRTRSYDLKSTRQRYTFIRQMRKNI